MRPHDKTAVETRPPVRGRAFSLAELMIAFAVLAMGLLVIGAALPIGVRYTQESAELDMGEAAGEYALDLIETSVSLCHSVYDPNKLTDPNRIHAPVLFQPRMPESHSLKGRLAWDPINPKAPWEPLIKVRPLYTRNVRMDEGDRGEVFYVNAPETVVAAALNSLIGSLPDPTLEYDAFPWMQPALPSVSMVYPPIYPDERFSTDDADPTDDPIVSRAERLRVLEQRTAWTAFYRRVSYAVDSDPALYEFIVVVTRRPTANHRYPVQSPGTKLRSHGIADVINGYAEAETVAPIPWLVVFNEARMPTDVKFPNAPRDVVQFVGHADVGRLVPVGSVIIPARNDVDPGVLSTAERIGLFPEAPSALPIYRVVERTITGNSASIVCENNGYRPADIGKSKHWLTGELEKWPVWIVPPAFEEYDADGPVYPDESPIIGVARRYIRLHEVP